MSMSANTLILVTADGIGRAEAPLSHKLVRTYFSLLDESNSLPGAVAFYTDGVKLVCEGSPVLDQLRALKERGVELIVCSTCLDYFGLRDKVVVGIVGGMPDIIEAMNIAEKVISL